MDRVVFSGIQPSGDLHLGNYIGAIKQWVAGQEQGLNIFCVVDLHAITVPQPPRELYEKTLEVAGLLIASGIDASKSLLFVQSQNPDHANLAWILNCYLSMGQMSRMTQFKEKSDQKDFVSVGLFDYPALMAADILLYGTTEVPVGEDQKQHVELARDAAEKFNIRHGETFVVPEPNILKEGGRVMSLSDPTKKMSKSDNNPASRIELLDEDKTIRKKILGAVTDSGNEVLYREDKPGISNLLEIYSRLTGTGIQEIEANFQGKNYGEFKESLADVIVAALSPIRKKYDELRDGEGLTGILEGNAERARQISHKKLLEVYQKVGFVG